MQPLRRRPKQLDGDPTLFESRGGAGGLIVTARGERGRANGRGSGAAGLTDEPAELLPVAPEPVAPDPQVLARAREIAARLALRRPHLDEAARSGTGELVSVRYRDGSDDLDLDATLDNLVANPFPEEDDIVVRERVRTRRAVVLAVDLSGSMRGERARTAAAAVGALGAELARDDLAVVVFWSDAAVLQQFGHRIEPVALVTAMLRIPAQGLTNVEFPLRVAARTLAGSSARDARVLLLSDCVHNAGPDPRAAASALPRLDVLLDVSGEQDEALARDLARLGRGRLARIRGYRDVAPAVTRLFAP